MADRAVHEIPPVFDGNSRVLVLGSFPSVKSREARFFYHHPQNRFWRLLASLFGEETPDGVEEKKAFLLRHGVAVWDVIASCEITCSSDSSIKNVVPNDISRILKSAPIRQIFCNGATSYNLYRRYCLASTGMDAVKLPSTSPANAACSLDRLAQLWAPVRDEAEGIPQI